MAGVSSPTSCRSRSTPEQARRSAARSGRRRRGSTSQPISVRISRSSSPGWVVRGRPVADRHATAGGGGRGRGTARRWTGRARSAWSTAATGPGATAHRLASVSSTSTPCCAQHRDRHLDVGERGHRLADVADVDAGVVAGAGEQQRRDELRRRAGVDHHRAAGHRPACRAPRTAGRRGRRRRRRPRARRSAVSISPTGRMPHVRVAVEGDAPVRETGHRRHEPHHGAGQAAVDVGVAVERRRASPPSRRPRGVLDAGAERGERGAISRVSRERSGRRTTLGPSAIAASTSARLVSDLLPGSDTTRSRPGRAAGAPARGRDASPAHPCRGQVSWALASFASRRASLARCLASRRASGCRATGAPGEARAAVGVDRRRGAGRRGSRCS